MARRQKRIPPAEAALRLSAAASESASDLARSARVLLETGLLGPAASLAVLASEEAAKSFLSGVWAISGDGNVDAWEYLFSNHRKKHGAALVVELMKRWSADIDLFEARVETRMRERFPMATEDSLKREGVAFVIHIFPALLPKLDRRLKNDLAGIEAEWKQRVDQGSMDKVKMRGFYADWDPASNEVLNPRTVTHEVADALVREAYDAVGTLEKIAKAMSDLGSESECEVRAMCDALARRIARRASFGGATQKPT